MGYTACTEKKTSHESMKSKESIGVHSKQWRGLGEKLL